MDVECVICGSDNVDELYQYDYVMVYQCFNCGEVFEEDDE